MHKKAFGEPSPAWGAYSTPADFLHGFKEAASQQGRDKRWEERKAHPPYHQFLDLSLLQRPGMDC